MANLILVSVLRQVLHVFPVVNNGRWRVVVPFV